MKQMKTKFLRMLIQKTLEGQFQNEKIVQTADIFDAVKDEYNGSKFSFDGELHIISVGIAMKQLGHKKMRMRHNIAWEIMAF